MAKERKMADQLINIVLAFSLAATFTALCIGCIKWGWESLNKDCGLPSRPGEVSILNVEGDLIHAKLHNGTYKEVSRTISPKRHITVKTEEGDLIHAIKRRGSDDYAEIARESK